MRPIPVSSHTSLIRNAFGAVVHDASPRLSSSLRPNTLLARSGPSAPTDAVSFFDAQSLKTLHDRQIGAVEYLDTVFARLFDLLPSRTWVIVTSDHGELFGEDRYFGHGPVMHEKVFEVPFVEGMVP